MEKRNAAWEPAATPDSVDLIAREYVRLAIALGERDPDSVDFSVAPPAVVEAVHKGYPTYDEMTREASALKDRLGALPLATGASEERSRAQFLVLQLNAVETRLAMLRGHNPGFENEARLLFDTSELPDTPEEIAHRKAVRSQILALLPPARGKTGAERYGEYDRKFLVPRFELQAVMTAALKACRDRTLEHIQMPADEGVDLTFVTNRPWSAFSRYQGHAHSTITVNLDLPVTVDDAMELACHEGYPGHHVFNTMRDVTLQQGRHWPEMRVQLTFTPQSYVSEAAAAYAPRMAFSEQERMKIERDVLFPLAGFNPADAEKYVRISSLIRELSSAEPAIAREYLEGKLEFVRAEEALADEALMDHPEAQLLYLNEFRSYMLAYTDGPRRFARALPATPSDDRWKAYRETMTHLVYTLPDPG